MTKQELLFVQTLQARRNENFHPFILITANAELAAFSIDAFHSLTKKEILQVLQHLLTQIDSDAADVNRIILPNTP